ncbi:MAG TPA: hypothetical protein PKV73_01310 [Agriterribacter sp.]|nr:hypothetical protein [Agriterribacter sp.]
MKHIKLTTGEYLLVEIPNHIEKVVWETGNEGKVLWMFSNRISLQHDRRIHVKPYGQWEIIGRASELNEEQWKEIVETISGWSSVLYYDYSAPGRDYRDIIESGLKSPTKSGISLIKSHSTNPSTTLVIRKIK